MSSSLATRIAEDFAAADQQPASAVDNERRQRAIHLLTERGLPTSRDENWKYVNLRPLEKVRFAPPGPRGLPFTVTDLPASIGRYARYTFVDGVLAPSLSAPTTQEGVWVDSMQHAAGATPTNVAALRPPLADAGAMGDLRFALLNEAFAPDGACIRVAAGTERETCIELLFVATADAKTGASYPRVELQIATGARVRLIERHVSVGSDASFINSAVNIEIGREAAVQHYRVQNVGARAIWFDTLTASLAEGARYRVHTVNLGGLSARSTQRVQLVGQHSEVGMFTVSVGVRNQVHDTFALVEHAAPNARTEQSFRGIASGRARVAFNGKIVVRKEAHGTDSRQSLRGLLAGGDAEIDVRPQLEIYTDEVRCSHGATAGKLDDDMLFYLLSRGLDREMAQRLLKWAFLEDVIAKIEVPELRRQIELDLVSKLNETAALKGAPYTAHGELREQFPWELQ
jgi:Fe-S cluster assembly protein SufD